MDLKIHTKVRFCSYLDQARRGQRIFTTDDKFREFVEHISSCQSITGLTFSKTRSIWPICLCNHKGVDKVYLPEWGPPGHICFQINQPILTSTKFLGKQIIFMNSLKDDGVVTEHKNISKLWHQCQQYSQESGSTNITAIFNHIKKHIHPFTPSQMRLLRAIELGTKQLYNRNSKDSPTCLVCIYAPPKSGVASVLNLIKVIFEKHTEVTLHDASNECYICQI